MARPKKQGAQRSRQLFVRSAFAAAVLAAAVIIPLSHTRAFQWLESGAYDARVRWTAKATQADKHIVIIDIDNASFDNLKELLGRWPWTRGVYTETIRYVNRGHPRAIAFDSIFSGFESVKGVPGPDEELAQMAQRAGNVVFGFTFNPTQIETSEEVKQADQERRAHQLQLLEREGSVAGASSLGEALSPDEYALNLPTDVLAQSAPGLGSVNAIIDPDGVTRRVALAFKYGDKTYPSLSVRTADIAEHKSSPGFVRVGREAEHNGWRIPVDQVGGLLLLWHGENVYERIPYWQMFCSIYPQQCAEKKVYFKPDYFRDRIVVMAASATGSYEVRPNPFSETAPGFMTHVTAIDNLLHHEAMRISPRWVLPLTVVVLALTGAAILVGFPSTAVGAGVLLVVLGAYSGLAFVAFGRWHLWLPLVAPVTGLLISFAASSAIRYATTGRELRRTRGTLDRYMAPQLVSYVLDNIDNIEFGGEKRELTILFSDVRNFTTLTERSEPLELISLLNEYLHEMTDVIFKYDGVVDKFIGDGILAYWGAFTPGKNHALQAAQASLEMFDRLKELNARWATEGRPCMNIGVGINTGDVIFGNVGAGKKIEFTVIGDTVNLAARLESLNKEKGTHIIISEFTLARLGDLAQVTSLGGVTVKGKTIETAVFELHGVAGTETATAMGGAKIAGQTPVTLDRERG